MKIIKLIFLGLLLQGCDFSGAKELTMPLYQDCLQPLKSFIHSVSGSTSVEFEIQKFDLTSDAHPFVIGFVVLRGSEGEDFEIHKNSVVSICLPSAMIATDRDWRGIERMVKRYDSLRTGGNAYLDITEDRISIFYNQKLNEAANSVLPQ